MPRKLETNEDLVRNLMQRSPVGPLVQVFIVTALQRYAEQCIAKGPEHFDTAMLSGAAWVRCAEDVKARIEAFYEARP